MKDLKQRTIRGGAAKFCSQGANFLLRMASLMILARLLDPKDFGLVGMVTAVIGVFSVFRDFGLSAAAVQRTSVTEEESSTLFWINLGLRYFQVEEAHRRALGRYSVQLYPGKITLMRAADVPETVGSHRNSTLGWETFAGGGLEIHDVPGGHISMFEEPNVWPLAETLKALLPSNEKSFPRKAQAEAFPPDSHSDNSQLGQSLADENDLGDVGDACPPSLGSWQLQSFNGSR
jgi:hypothetical protein